MKNFFVLFLVFFAASASAIIGSSEDGSYSTTGGVNVGSAMGDVDGVYKINVVLGVQPVGIYADDQTSYYTCLGNNFACRPELKPVPAYSVKVEPETMNFSVGNTQVVDKIFFLSNEGNVDLLGFSCRVDDFNANWVSVVDCPSELKVSDDNKPVRVRFDARSQRLGPHNVGLSFGNNQARDDASVLAVVFDDSGGQGSFDFMVFPDDHNFILGLDEKVTNSYFVSNTGLNPLGKFTCLSPADRPWVSVHEDTCPDSLDVGGVATVLVDYDGINSGKQNGDTDNFNLVFDDETPAAQKQVFVSVRFSESGGDVGYPTPLADLPSDVDFVTAICPSAVVVSRQASVVVKLYNNGIPVCDNKLKISVRHQDDTEDTVYEPYDSCPTPGLNSFNVEVLKGGLYTALVNYSNLDNAAFLKPSSCTFRALGTLQVQAPETDFIAVIMLLLGVVFVLGKKKV